jgi:hypothetical protein
MELAPSPTELTARTAYVCDERDSGAHGHLTVELA